MSHLREQSGIDVAVVIVNFRSTPLLLRCLETIERHGVEAPTIRVHVCENASGDGSGDRIRREIESRGWSDWVSLVVLDHNRGFTGGNNVLLQRLLDSSRPPSSILLLNPDTEVEPAAITRMFECLAGRPDWGVVGPSIVGADGKLQGSCFNDPTPWSEFLRAANTGPLDHFFRRRRTSKAPPHDEGPHDWTSFAAAMLRPAALRAAGIFDEGYFAYFDDPDLCWRIRRAGWLVGHCPDARIMHLEGASTGIRDIRQERRRLPGYQMRGRARYFAKRHGVAGLWAANLCWNVGRLVSWTRELIERRPSHLPKAVWRDIWTNAFRPWHAPHLPHPPIHDELEQAAPPAAVAAAR
jgi:N-acetylglucosaminyl-diphospho-decaprenol L-rhamnosyltransferase